MIAPATLHEHRVDSACHFSVHRTWTQRCAAPSAHTALMSDVMDKENTSGKPPSTAAVADMAKKLAPVDHSRDVFNENQNVNNVNIAAPSQSSDDSEAILAKKKQKKPSKATEYRRHFAPLDLRYHLCTKVAILSSKYLCADFMQINFGYGRRIWSQNAFWQRFPTFLVDGAWSRWG